MTVSPDIAIRLAAFALQRRGAACRLREDIASDLTDKEPGKV
jgi:hypothetical protein